MSRPRTCLSLLTIACMVASVRAELPPQAGKSYWEALQAVQYEPNREDLLGHKKAQIDQALQGLEAFLRPGGQQVVAGWKEYLAWQALQAELALPRPDPALLAGALLNLRCNQAGLEHGPFIAVRDSLQEYLATVQFRCPRDPQAALDEAVRRLQELLVRYEQAPTRADARAIASLLACLQRSGPSARQAAAAIRAEYDRPNALVRVSQRFLAHMMPREIDERQTAIQETHSRVSTRGFAVTRLEAKGQLVPDDQQGTVDIQIHAITRAPRTISTAGPVTVYGSFVARTDVRKRLSIEEEGLSFRPARANGSASVAIQDVVADRRIIEWIAERRANRRLPEAEDDISQSSARQVRETIDHEVERVLVNANRVYYNDFRNPMLRYGAFPEKFSLSSSSDFLQLVIKVAKSAQLGAPTALPELDPEHDLGFAMHASFFENFAELSLAGKSIADNQWLNFMGTLTGDEPRPLWVHDRSKPWSFTFADRYPILVRLDNDQFTVTACGQRVTRGETQITRRIEVAATYRAIHTPDGVAFIRQGNLQAGWSDGSDSQNAQHQEMLGFVGRKFQGILQPAIYFDAFVPPAGSQFAKLRDFQVAEFAFQDDWVTIGFQLAKSQRDELVESQTH